MIESSSNVTFIVVLWYFKGTTFFSLLLPLTLYLVILPYAFLMNTSENKNRIVDLGWKNVIRNLFRLSKGSSEDRDEHDPKDNEPNTSSGYNTGSGSETQIAKNDQNTVSAISDQSMQPKYSARNTLKDAMSTNPPLSNPKTSASCSGYVNLNVNDLVSDADRYKVSQNLISSMIKCGNKEEDYMSYFKNLVTFREQHKTECILYNIEFPDNHEDNIDKANKSENEAITDNGTKDADDIPEKYQRTSQMLKGTIQERTQNRMELLSYIYSLSNDDKKHYNESLERLIDLEEAFILDD